MSWRPIISSRLEDLRVFISPDLERSTLSGNWADNGLGDGGRSRSIIALVAPGDHTGSPSHPQQTKLVVVTERERVS